MTFFLFTQRNPKSCPLLEVGDVGDKFLKYLGKDINIAKDIPKYRIYKKGELIGRIYRYRKNFGERIL